MYNDAFDPNGEQPQHTMRCITGRSNGAGGRVLSTFRQGGSKYKNIWKHHRLGPSKPFDGTGGRDWFYVNFNFDFFNDNNSCSPKSEACKNDGRQFHVTKLVQVGAQSASSNGAMAWPYDALQNNAYRLDGENADIEQYHVTLNITGDDRDEVSANVFVHRNGQRVELDRTRNAVSLQNGDSIMLQGDLPRPLNIIKHGIGCAICSFLYGNKALDGYRVFPFNSEDDGLGEWAYVKTAPEGTRLKYCQREDIMDVSDRKRVIGTRLLCSFPGW